uniref:Uncharacterized protein n=1 Tax=Oryza sativa subsp. japonica TaxID=39947 RepID=Q6Z6A1_ORYSJ|nr:hypothetical protein [Oryza sativa Japonica Group]
MTASGGGSTVLSHALCCTASGLRPRSPWCRDLGREAVGESKGRSEDGRSDACDFLLPIPKHGNRTHRPIQRRGGSMPPPPNLRGKTAQNGALARGRVSLGRRRGGGGAGARGGGRGGDIGVGGQVDLRRMRRRKRGRGRRRREGHCRFGITFSKRPLKPHILQRGPPQLFHTVDL